jgi:putative ABC transport system substrate-binding protein
VLVVTGGTVAALAAKAATSTIPIVFTIGGDPVASGLVASLNRPGGNITGISRLSTTNPKRLELLREMVPKVATIAFLRNPKDSVSDPKVGILEAIARTIGQPLHALTASDEPDIDTAFATLVAHGDGALLIDNAAFFVGEYEHLATLALQYSIPSMASLREFPTAGGLMSYGTSIVDAHRQVGVYTGRILKGEKPGDLPVMQPTRFELVINLKTAKALGLEVPANLLALADEVIE